MFSKEEAIKHRKQFWDAFDNRTARIPIKGKRRKQWILGKTGIKGLILKFAADKSNASVIWEIYYKDQDKTDEVYELIYSYRAVINEFLDSDFIWDNDVEVDTDTGRYYCGRIYKTLNGVSIFKQDDWNTIFDFFIVNMTKIESAFDEIKDVLKEKI